MTRKEVMEKLKKNENDIGEAVKELLEEMCPFDINDEEALKIENRPQWPCLPGFCRV